MTIGRPEALDARSRRAHTSAPTRRACRGALLLCLLPAAAHGAVWTVCPFLCDSPTIAGAIAAADPGDTVHISVSPHTEAGILIDRDLTIEGVSETATIVQAATLPGSMAGRVFDVPAGVTATLRKMTVRHGDALGEPSPRNGGAIRNLGTLELVNVRVESSLAGGGGGIYNEGALEMTGGRLTGNEALGGGGLSNAGTATLNQTVVTANLASDVDVFMPISIGGAGISNSGTLQLVETMVLENSIDTSLASVQLGGGIYSGCDLVVLGGQITGNDGAQGGGGILLSTPSPCSVPAEIHDTVISFNSAGTGGGVGTYGDGSSLRIVNTTLAHNSAGTGGALGLSEATVSLSESLIESNEASTGGGLSANSGSVSLRNVTLSGNRALRHGGAVHAAYYSLSPVLLRLSNVTITGNVADDDADSDGEGGGVYVETGATVEVSNSVISGNVDASPPSLSSSADCRGALGSFGHNLVGTLGTAPFMFAKPCALVPDSTSPGGDLVGADPKLDPLADNGGPTRTHALLPGSAAIDSGDPAGCFELSDALLPPLIPWDQRGALRDLLCDRGAFEAGSTPSKIFGDGFEHGDTGLWYASVF